MSRLWFVVSVAAFVVLAACSSAPTPLEDVGRTAAALTCGPTDADWSDFPASTSPPSCVAGVKEFYARKFPGSDLGGTPGGGNGRCESEGACNYWFSDAPPASLWDRFDWGSTTPMPYDLVVFEPIGTCPSTYVGCYGHVASVDHWDAATGQLFVMDANYADNNTGLKAPCVHTVSYPPYGFFRLKSNETPPVRGSLDTANCQQIAGWAEDPDASGTAIDVELYLDGPKGTGSLLDTVSAGVSRADLCAAIGSCDHAFSVAPAASLYDGLTHSVYAYGIHVASGGSDALLSSSPQSLHCAAALAGDFHGTGRAEVVQFRDDWTTLASCGREEDAWSCESPTATYVGGVGAGNDGSAIFPGSTALVGDMNGDGRDDLLEWNPGSTSIPVCFSTDHGWACENLEADYVGGLGAGNAGSGVFAGGKAFVADLNGDGKADLVQYNPSWKSIPVCFATNGGWSCENLEAHYVGGAAAGNGGGGLYGSPTDGTTAFLADVNGDGKPDLVQYNAAWTTLPVCFSTGHGWSCENLAAPSVGGTVAGNAGSGIYRGASAQVADVNGDGKADLVEYDPAGTTLPVCFSSGHGWSCEALAATYVGGVAAGNQGSGVYGGATVLLADMNGDGRADVVQYIAGAASLPVCFSTDHGWSCSALGLDSLGVTAPDGGAPTSALPSGSTLVAPFTSGHASIVEVSPESGATTLPICGLGSTGWTCANDAATVQ